MARTVTIAWTLWPTSGKPIARPQPCGFQSGQSHRDGGRLMAISGIRVRDYSQLRSALSARRRQLGLRQLEVDELAGTQSGYCGKVESNVRKLGDLSLPMILCALDCDLILIPRTATVAPVEHVGSAGHVQHLNPKA
jgi:hypothetical protein